MSSLCIAKIKVFRQGLGLTYFKHYLPCLVVGPSLNDRKFVSQDCLNFTGKNLLGYYNLLSVGLLLQQQKSSLDTLTV